MDSVLVSALPASISGILAVMILAQLALTLLKPASLCAQSASERKEAPAFLVLLSRALPISTLIQLSELAITADPLVHPVLDPQHSVLHANPDLPLEMESALVTTAVLLEASQQQLDANHAVLNAQHVLTDRKSVV